MIDVTREKIIWARIMAQRLNIDQRTLERWFKDGLESVKIRRKTYTTWEAIDRFLQAQKSESSASKKCGGEPKETVAAPAASRKQKLTEQQAEPQSTEQQQCCAARNVSTAADFID